MGKSFAETVTEREAAEIAAQTDGGTPAPEDEDEGELDEELEDESRDPDEEEVDETDDESEVTDDVPDDYMGFDLSGLEPERKAAIVAKLKEQDRYVQSLQKKAKELEGKASRPEPQQEPEPTPMPSTEEIIEKLYGKPDDDPLFDVKAEAAKPLLEILLPLTAQIQQMQQTTATEQFLASFDATMNELETEFGLPEGMTRDDVLDFMVENDIGDTEAAFIRATRGKTRIPKTEAKSAGESDKARRAAKKAVKTRRPTRTAKTDPAEPKKGITVREAIIEAAREQNFDLDNASRTPWLGAV